MDTETVADRNSIKLHERSRRATCCFLLVALLSVWGCGGGGKPAPKTVRVSGTIYLDDEPLEDALVTFTNEGFASTGRTNAEGKYELVQGAVPGENVVSISKWEGDGIELNPEEGMDEGQFEAMTDPSGIGKVDVNVGPQQVIPEQYSDTEKSGLKYPVPEDGAEGVDFRLQSN